MISSLLFYPFGQGTLPQPQSGQKTLLWDVRPVPEAKDFEDFDCLQNFRPYADEWAGYGKTCLEKASISDVYHYVLCAVSKQKEQALYQLASSLYSLKESGYLIAAAENNAGGKRLEGWFKELGLVPQSQSKSKCRIVWAVKNGIDKDKIQRFIDQGLPQQISLEGVEYITIPGIYGWNKIDVGSKILTEIVPEKLSGIGADFGCGYGYLSRHVLGGAHSIKKLYMADADKNALDCAHENLKSYADRVEIDYRWEDLTAHSKNINALDWIIMNPPFHEGKQTDLSVGQKFIETAAQSLKKGGRLYMVANAHLPYEKMLANNFSSVEKTIEKQGFKVFSAVK